MGIYSNITLDEINDILGHYELGRALDFSPTITGISNSNFRVHLESGEDVLLKISNDKTLEQLTNEQRILNALEHYSFKYSIHPFKTILGKTIYHQEKFFGVVFPFINGFPPLINENSCYEIGRALGELHSLEIKKEDLNTIRPHDFVGHSGQSVYEYTRTENAPRDFVEAFEEIFPEHLQDIPFDTFPVGIIHGDLYFDNCLFHNQTLVTLIDFEQAGRGHYLLDIGISLSGCCFNRDRSNLDMKLIKAYMRGYESKRRLLTIEEDYLMTSILIGFFSIGLWRIKRFYEGNLDESKRYNYRELIQRARNFKNEYLI